MRCLSYLLVHDDDDDEDDAKIRPEVTFKNLLLNIISFAVRQKARMWLQF